MIAEVEGNIIGGFKMDTMSRIYSNVNYILRNIFHILHLCIRLYIIVFLVAIVLVVIRYTVPATESMPAYFQFVDEVLIPCGNNFFKGVMKYLK